MAPTKRNRDLGRILKKMGDAGVGVTPKAKPTRVKKVKPIGSVKEKSTLKKGKTPAQLEKYKKYDVGLKKGRTPAQKEKLRKNLERLKEKGKVKPKEKPFMEKFLEREKPKGNIRRQFMKPVLKFKKGVSNSKVGKMKK